MTVYVTHDQTYLYLAASFDRKGEFHPLDLVSFEFDNDKDGKREDGDDLVFIHPSTPLNVAGPVFDFYRYNGARDNGLDTSDGGTNDGISAWGAIGSKGVFEIRHPLNSADDAHDFSINTWISRIRSVCRPECGWRKVRSDPVCSPAPSIRASRRTASC